MMARFDYLDQSEVIKTFNSRPKPQRNKVKYVFTSHPTQPNSVEQIEATSLIMRGLEENDPVYLSYAMKMFM